MNVFKRVLAGGVMMSLILVTGCEVSEEEKKKEGEGREEGEMVGDLIREDDWVYERVSEEEGFLMSNAPKAGGRFNLGRDMVAASAETGGGGGNIGLAVGGAQDINNFRENIERGYLPLVSDITYEGIFYDYFFETGEVEECEKLFCPSYRMAVTKDPLSEEEEYYMAVGLNSGIKESDFERKKLNLVVVMDISGSMSSPFDKYYYDQAGGVPKDVMADDDYGKSKMEIAKRALKGFVDRLDEEDRLGVVLFNGGAYLAKGLRKMKGVKVDKLKEHIDEVVEGGGTNMEAGISEGVKLFEELKDADKDEYENRIIFLTDAMPNTGRTGEDSLLGMTKKNAEEGIYTTFIGVGVDFQTELVEKLTKVRGANYYSVHSAYDFKRRMDTEFEYMVTPLVFNLVMEMEAEGWEIERVFGSPEAEEASGELMRVNTLFPSERQEGRTKGGIILLKLKKTGEGEGGVKLVVSYEDRSGKKEEVSEEVEIEKKESEYFADMGVRKGVLLVRYVNLMRNWIMDEREAKGEEEGEEEGRGMWDSEVEEEGGLGEMRVCYKCGIPLPPKRPELGRWERSSMDLEVGAGYREIMEDFKDYFEEEMVEIGDESLGKEVEIMEKIIGS